MYAYLKISDKSFSSSFLYTTKLNLSQLNELTKTEDHNTSLPLLLQLFLRLRFVAKQVKNCTKPVASSMNKEIELLNRLEGQIQLPNLQVQTIT